MIIGIEDYLLVNRKEQQELNRTSRCIGEIVYDYGKE